VVEVVGGEMIVLVVVATVVCDCVEVVSPEPLPDWWGDVEVVKPVLVVWLWITVVLGWEEVDCWVVLTVWVSVWVELGCDEVVCWVVD